MKCYQTPTRRSVEAVGFHFIAKFYFYIICLIYISPNTFGGFVKGLDSLTGPESVCANRPLWFPVVSHGRTQIRKPFLSFASYLYFVRPAKIKFWQRELPQFTFELSILLIPRFKKWPRMRPHLNLCILSASSCFQ